MFERYLRCRIFRIRRSHKDRNYFLMASKSVYAKTYLGKFTCVSARGVISASSRA